MVSDKANFSLFSMLFFLVGALALRIFLIDPYWSLLAIGVICLSMGIVCGIIAGQEN